MDFSISDPACLYRLHKENLNATQELRRTDDYQMVNIYPNYSRVCVWGGDVCACVRARARVCFRVCKCLCMCVNGCKERGRRCDKPTIKSTLRLLVVGTPSVHSDYSINTSVLLSKTRTRNEITLRSLGDN